MWRTLAAVMFLIGVISCAKSEEDAGGANEVVLYSSVDEPYLRPVLKRFEAETGIRVRLTTDAEASKTAGLAGRLEAERSNPRADVYWGNEPFHTIRLTDAGVLESYRPKSAEDVPAQWRDPQDRWVAVGLRARVIVVSARERDGAAAGGIRSLEDLARPEFKGRIGMAHPGFGTTSGHMAALYVGLGPEKFAQLVKSWKANGMILLGGNSIVVEQVAGGNLLAGLTDNDDVANARAEGAAVDAVVPDQAGTGTLLVPTTVALVKGGPQPEPARRLADFLADARVERELLDARFLAYSVRGDTGVKAMGADYGELARAMPQAVRVALEILEERGSE